MAFKSTPRACGFRISVPFLRAAKKLWDETTGVSGKEVSGRIEVDDTENFVRLVTQFEGDKLDEVPSGEGDVDFHTHPRTRKKNAWQTLGREHVPSFDDVKASLQQNNFHMLNPDWFVQQAREAREQLRLEGDDSRRLALKRMLVHSSASVIIVPDGLMIYCFVPEIVKKFQAQVRTETRRRARRRIADDQYSAEQLTLLNGIVQGRARFYNQTLMGTGSYGVASPIPERKVFAGWNQLLLASVLVFLQTASFLYDMSMLSHSEFLRIVRDGDVSRLQRAFNSLPEPRRRMLLLNIAVGVAGKAAAGTVFPGDLLSIYLRLAPRIAASRSAEEAFRHLALYDNEVAKRFGSRRSSILPLNPMLVPHPLFSDFELYLWKSYLPSSSIRGLLTPSRASNR